MATYTLQSYIRHREVPWVSLISSGSDHKGDTSRSFSIKWLKWQQNNNYSSADYSESKTCTSKHIFIRLLQNNPPERILLRSNWLLLVAVLGLNATKPPILLNMLETVVASPPACTPNRSQMTSGDMTGIHHNKWWQGVYFTTPSWTRTSKSCSAEYYGFYAGVWSMLRRCTVRKYL